MHARAGQHARRPGSRREAVRGLSRPLGTRDHWAVDHAALAAGAAAQARTSDVCLVDEPPVASGVPAGSRRVDQQRGVPLHPPPHAHVIDGEATLGQQFFDVSAGEPVAQVPANRERDHIRREAKPREAGSQCWHRRERRRIEQACLILLFTDATGPAEQIREELASPRAVPDVQLGPAPGMPDLPLLDRAACAFMVEPQDSGWPARDPHGGETGCGLLARPLGSARISWFSRRRAGGGRDRVHVAVTDATGGPVPAATPTVTDTAGGRAGAAGGGGSAATATLTDTAGGRAGASGPAPGATPTVIDTVGG